MRVSPGWGIDDTDDADMDIFRAMNMYTPP